MRSFSAILLGASAFTHLSIDHSRKSFGVSAALFRSYLKDQLLIPEEGILDLFDSPKNVADQDEELATFLKEQGNRSIVLYYVGHGGFAASGDNYYLALKSTHPQRDGITSYTTAQLAKTLDRYIAKTPVFLIIDACFSAETVKNFMDTGGDGLINGLSNQLTDRLPSCGAALLCAASPNLPAISLGDTEPTAFTKCLMKALEQGNNNGNSLLNFRELAKLTQIHIRKLNIDGVPLPQFHCPRQTEGDISSIPLFPNPPGRQNTPLVHPRAFQVFATELRLREKDLRQQELSKLQSLLALGDAMLEGPHHNSSVDEICDNILSSQHEEPLIIAAPPKSGKTLLAAIIALALATRKQSPRYLDLALALLAGSTLDVDRLKSQKLREFRSLAQDISATEAHESNEILILDGLDPSLKNFEVFETFEQRLRETKHKCIEFVTASSPNQLPAEYQPDIEIETPNLDTEHAQNLIDAFLRAKSELMSGDITPPNRDMLVRQLQHVGSERCSIFLLSIADDWLRKNKELGSEYQIGKQHTNFFIQRSVRNSHARDRIRNKAKQRAFRAFFKIAEHEPLIESKERKASVSFTRFISDSLTLHHPLIRNFLIAQFVIDHFCEFGREGKASRDACWLLNCVYPYAVNRIQRQMLFEEDVAVSALKGIGVVLSSKIDCYYLKAHACYLAGRFKGQYRTPAIELLERYRNTIEDLPFDNSEARLFHRSYFISLAYLGVETAAHQYVEELMDDERLDLVNRGFHLEYYGDRTYRPEVQLQNIDDLKECPITFDKICTQLEADKNIEKPYDIVSFYTLLSLVQHRMVAGEDVPSDIRVRVSSLIKDCVKPVIVGPRISAYARVTQKALDQNHFCALDALFVMHGIKEQRRMGWVERGIDNGESVADHTYGAYLLGLVLLPSKIAENDSYDKQHILNMVLSHDLAESKIGDFTPNSKDREKKEKLERDFFDEISFLGSFPGFAPLGPVRKLFIEFSEGATFNAKVARDLDRLENLITLKKYTAMNYSIDDSEEWAVALQNSIMTAPGKAILRILIEHEIGVCL